MASRGRSATMPPILQAEANSDAVLPTTSTLPASGYIDAGEHAQQRAERRSQLLDDGPVGDEHHATVESELRDELPGDEAEGEKRKEAIGVPAHQRPIDEAQAKNEGAEAGPRGTPGRSFARCEGSASPTREQRGSHLTAHP